jgi:hypothetical protein
MKTPQRREATSTQLRVRIEQLEQDARDHEQDICNLWQRIAKLSRPWWAFWR